MESNEITKKELINFAKELEIYGIYRLNKESLFEKISVWENFTQEQRDYMSVSIRELKKHASSIGLYNVWKYKLNTKLDLVNRIIDAED